MNYTLDFRLARQWISLTDEQWNALEKAAEHTIVHPAAEALLEKDVAHLAAGNLALASTEEERISAYGQPLHLLQPALVLLCRLPWLIERYQAHGIEEQVLRDSLTDMRIWMDVCEKRTGHPGMLEYVWLAFTFTFRLFRLGRLQFCHGKNNLQAHVYRHADTGMVMALCPDGAAYYSCGDALDTNGHEQEPTWTAHLREENGFVEGCPITPTGQAQQYTMRLDLHEWTPALLPGDSVLELHIPEGAPLTPESVAQSLAQVPDFFEKHLSLTGLKGVTCESWLLDDIIARMQPGSNIARFQQFFHLVPVRNANDGQTRERAFGDRQADILTADCHTSLQKRIAAWYRAGGHCREQSAFILLR